MPPKEVFANYGKSTLAAAILQATASPLSITVATGEGAKFPAANFYVSIDLELFWVTSRAADVLTANRAQRGTVAAAHAVTATVLHGPFAHHLQELEDESLRNIMLRSR